MSRTGVGRCHWCGCDEKLTHFDDCAGFQDHPEGLRFIPRPAATKEPEKK